MAVGGELAQEQDDRVLLVLEPRIRLGDDDGGGGDDDGGGGDDEDNDEHELVQDLFTSVFLHISYFQVLSNEESSTRTFHRTTSAQVNLITDYFEEIEMRAGEREKKGMKNEKRKRRWREWSQITEKDQGVQMPAKVDFRNSQVTLDEANAMLAEFESDKETAMDTLTDGDEGIQVGQIPSYNFENLCLVFLILIRQYCR